MTHPADEAAELMQDLDAKHVRQNAAERILDKHDWQALTDMDGKEIMRCGTCWHAVPRHHDGCALYELALEVARLRAGEQKEMSK